MNDVVYYESENVCAVKEDGSKCISNPVCLSLPEFNSSVNEILDMMKNLNISAEPVSVNSDVESKAAAFHDDLQETSSNVLLQDCKRTFDEEDLHTKFYAVSLPSESVDINGDQRPLVYEEKSDALRAIKTYKGARFKEFTSWNAAVNFALQDVDTGCPSPLSITTIDIGTSTESLINFGEKPSPFKSVTSQEIVKLRKAIERGDISYFTDTVWQNPRYLVNSGDAPTIMHEGFRYNALHVAARHGKSDVCELTLDIIQSPNFFEMLYDDDSPSTRLDRINRVTDLYLNTPDRGLGETPLHFAAKFGHLSVVKILLSHPSCIKDKVNKSGLTAQQVIYSRCPNYSNELKFKMEEAFKGLVYVPVLRDENNSVQPIVGKPCSPKFVKLSNHKSVKHPESYDSSVSIKAFAGPMSPEAAEKFYKLWRSPASPQPFTYTPEEQKLVLEIRLSDMEKGLERIGRKLAEELETEWQEYWPVLGAYVNLASSVGLQMLENHLRNCSGIKLKSSVPSLNKTYELCHEIPCQNPAIANAEKKNTLNPEFLTPPGSPVCGDCDNVCDSSDDEFVTPPDSPSATLPSSALEIFVQGSELSKHDIDMFNAVETIDIDRQNYPYVYGWKCFIKTQLNSLKPNHSSLCKYRTPASTATVSKLCIRAAKDSGIRKKLF